MRPFPPLAAFLGSIAVAVPVATAAGAVYALPSAAGLWGALATGLLVWVAGVLLVYRLTVLAAGPRPGEIAPGTWAEIGYFTYLFQQITNISVLRRMPLPILLQRPLWQAMGARLGRNACGSGCLLDPHLVTAGADTLIGEDALLICHVLEGQHISHAPIQLGQRVTIGARAIVMPGVTVGDDAVVAAGAVVAKNTVISAGSIWGGVPARCLRGGPAGTQVSQDAA